jgi:endonuclease/exonuclease/phosphatase (EEP) superfamily protein YafD
VIQKVLGFGLRDAWTECGEGTVSLPGEQADQADRLSVSDRDRSAAPARVIETQASDHRPLLVTVVAK